MRKTVLFAVALATTATLALSSCSNDDDLSQVSQETKGTPFRVYVNEDTRATELKTNTLSSFALYGWQSSPANYWLIKNANNIVGNGEDAIFFNGGNAAGWTASVEKTWPTSNTDAATTFYGYADGTTLNASNALPVGVSNLTLTPTKQQFTYTPTTKTSNLVYGFVDQLKTGEQTVIDNDSQNDLLICKQSATEGEDGKLSLTFDHALANLVIKAEFYHTNNGNGTGINESSKLTIHWIRVVNLAGSGTYNYATGEWTTGDKVIYEYVPETEIEVPAQKHATGESRNCTTIVPAGALMVIPQTYTRWDGNIPGGGNTSINNNYEMTSQVYVEMSVTPLLTSSTGKRRQRVVMPLSITGNKLSPNTQHTVVLNLNYCQQPGSTNPYAWTPSGFSE